MLSHRTRTQFLRFAARCVDVKCKSIELKIATGLAIKFPKNSPRPTDKKNRITKESYGKQFYDTTCFNCISLLIDNQRQNHCIYSDRKFW